MKQFLIIALILVPFLSPAQRKTAEDKPAYPQDYFRNPLEIPIFLAGNFGECRSGHFHSGMDIKTLGVENQPVHAAADGYVSRIKMESGGFGHGLYITHPNGYTTLYAHLNKFAPALQKYVERQQYEQKRWNVDIQFAATQFPVTKGEQIAWSGNTGGSTAPHLHFEIRNTKTEHPLNPQLFGMPVIDKIAPVPVEVVLFCDNTDGAGSFYETNKITIALAKKGDTYKPSKNDKGTFYKINGDTVSLPKGNIGIGINVDDFMDGSDNTIAFYTAKLFMDDSLQAQVTLDNIGYDESRYINAYADYKTKQQQHKWVQCLFQLPGNHLDAIYSNLNAAKGKIRLDDTLKHKVTIVITDDKDNQSSVVFFAGSAAAPKPPASYNLAIGTPFYANRQNVFNDANVAFSLDNRQLYDDISFVFKTAENSDAWSDKCQLHYPYVPLHHYFELKVKSNKPVPPALANKVAMIYTDGKDENGRAATPAETSWYKAKVRDFGTYWLAIDTIPPVIKPMQKNGANLAKAAQIVFEVKDGVTSVKSFSGYLDGKWICFEQHGSQFFYNFDAHCPRGKHELVFKAEDENGNERSVKLAFTR
jgi:hypothetical protein